MPEYEERDDALSPAHLLARCKHLLKHVEAQATDASQKINRGPGGREVSLCLTKVQEAHDWIARAQGLVKE